MTPTEEDLISALKYNVGDFTVDADGVYLKFDGVRVSKIDNKTSISLILNEKVILSKSMFGINDNDTITLKLPGYGKVKANFHYDDE